MNYSLTAIFSLGLAIVFTGLALVGDRIALAQLRTGSRGCNKLVQALRRSQYAAVLGYAAFVASAAVFNLRVTAAAMVVGALLGGVLALPQLRQGLRYQPLVGSILPCTLVVTALAHVCGLSNRSLELSVLVCLEAVGLAAGFWLLTELRNAQHQVRLRA